MKSTGETATVPRSRRSILAAVAGAAAAAAAGTLARPLSAAAANGDPLILGQGNAAPDVTGLDGKLEVRGIPAPSYPTTITVTSQGSTDTRGIAVLAESDAGHAILATTRGTHGEASCAVAGLSATAGGIGVLAGSPGAGVGLHVRGRTKLVNRSGRATVATGRATVDIDLRRKGGLSGTPLCFANLMSHRPGVFVTTVGPNFPVAGKARIYLNRTVRSNTHVAWVVLN
jgi:hypothetical protein